MHSLRDFGNQLDKFLAAQGLNAQDMQTLALLVALIALLFSVLALLRARKASAITVNRLSGKTDQAAIQFGDLKSKLERDYQRLLEEFSTIRERLARAEQKLAPSVPPSADDKKKIVEPSAAVDDVAVDSVVVDGAIPETPATFTATAAPESAPASADEESSSVFYGLRKTRQAFFSRLSGIFAKRETLDDAAFEELEELLITSDIGVQTSHKLLGRLKEKVSAGQITDAAACRAYLKESVMQLLGTAFQGEIKPEKQNGFPLVILVVGVNGVGKTTTIGKLARRFSAQGAKVLLGAADTFRAAAAEQIEVWAERANVEVLTGADNAKPSTVAFEAVHMGIQQGFDVVIIDTAGRLHTRVNLMNELESVINLINREQPGAPHETLLIVDATTGQNALEQAREFKQRAKLSGVIVTKLDGTPKGGIVVAIRDELGLPIRYIGVGESAADLKAFSASEFSDALFSEEDSGSFTAEMPKSQLRAVRRRPASDGPTVG